MRKIRLTFAALTFLVGGSEIAFSDIVQTRRGEFHNGIVAQDIFHLTTPYGEIAVQKARMAHLLLAPDNKGKDRIVSIDGEIFSGKLVETTLTTTRALGPDLPLDTKDIQLIEFEHNRKDRAALTALTSPLDLVEMNNGDIFLGYHKTHQFTLDNDGQSLDLNSTDTDLLDLTYSEDEEVIKARLRRKTDQRWLNGLLEEGEIGFTTLEGQLLSLPFKALQSMEFSYAYERKAEVTKLLLSGFPVPSGEKSLRDRFVDGSTGPLLRILDAGQYLRGDAAGDFDEKPVQQVTLSKPFAIGVFEITFAEYSRFCRDRFYRR